MKKKILPKLSLLLITSALNFSCKKDNGSRVDFPHDMYISKIKVKSDVRLFSNKSEINDVSTRNRFISNETFFNLDTRSIDPSEKITFITQDTARFSSSTTKYFFEKKDNLYLFYSDYFPVLLSSDDDLLNDLIKFNYPKTPLPFATGYKYKTKEVRVARGNYKELQLSVLSYKLNKGNYSWRAGTLFNEFNDGVVSKLGLNDTLAIKEFIIYLNAK